MGTTARIAAFSVAGILALAGCSADEDEATPPDDQRETGAADVDSVQESDDEPDPEAEAEVSERGNLVKDIGEMAGVQGEEDGEPFMEFTVTDLVVDGECTAERADPSENGHLVFVVLSVSTASAETFPDDVPLTFHPGAFSIIGADGLTEHELDTRPAYSCLPDGEAMPSGIGPGENVVGTVVLDTANPSGTLVFKPGWVDGGWEWSY